MTSSGSALETRYRAVLKTVQRANHPVTLIAVSKGQPIEAVADLYALGHRDFGENYVQELLTKHEALESRGCSGIRWHFIGHLQTNKVKALLPLRPTIHSVDRLSLIEELDKQAHKRGLAARLPCFVELKLGSDVEKTGAPPSELMRLLKSLKEAAVFEVLGLMTVASTEGDPGAEFAELVRLSRGSQLVDGQHMHDGKLSMGMSQDYAVALKLGATHVRIGSSIFGSRGSSKMNR